jgi:hypothetical protein
MSNIRLGGSRFLNESKSLKHILKFIATIINIKVTSMKHNPYDEFSLKNIDFCFYQYISTNFGMDKLANKYCGTFLVALV